MTDDSKIEARKNALLQLKSRRSVPMLCFLGLFFFSVNVLAAIVAGTVYVGWIGHAITPHAPA
jgi:hypothetical protein